MLAAFASGITFAAASAKVTSQPHHPTVKAQAGKIASFDADITLTKQGLLDVTEKIDMDFGQTQRHGIYRFVPVRYHRGAGVYTTYLRMLSITDEHGAPYPYKRNDDGHDVVFKIGDSNKLLTGHHQYRLHYQVAKAINFFNKEPELYWNVTGDQSQYAVDAASATIHLPTPNLAGLRTEAFFGPPGSTAKVPVSETSDTLVVRTGRLAPGEGLTVAVRMPAGAVTLPKVSQEILWFLGDWHEAFILPIVTMFMLFVYWLAFGKDKGNKSAVGVEWEPPKELSPAEVGTLIDEKCDLTDITSTLVDLAARGHLKIEQIPYNGILMMSKHDYRFTELTPPPDAAPLKLHESLMLTAIFGYISRESSLSSLKGKFYSHIPDIRHAVYNSLLTQIYFARDPNTDRSTFVTFGVIIMVVGLACVIFAGNDLRASSIGFLISGVVVALASNAMPARTAKGAAALNQCLAFKKFVEKAEKKRLEVLAKEDPTIFGRLLPYAMVLGCAEQWSKAFKELAATPPDWYVSDSSDGWTTYSFAQDLGYSLSNISRALSSPPMTQYHSNGSSGPGSSGGFGGGSAGGGSSAFGGGGGFSGGGFGGGGVSSW